MRTISDRKIQSQRDNYNMLCPYSDINRCRASISSLFIDKRRKEHYCSVENYDDCPIFLAKILRMVSKDSSSRREFTYEF